MNISIARLKADRAKGMTVREIAARRGCSREFVRRRLIAAGVELGPRGRRYGKPFSRSTLTHMRTEVLAKVYEVLTLAEMAAVLKVSFTQVRNEMLSRGIKLRPSGRRKGGA